jgi:parvulin-like peptidyl-prolyl isomerase
MKFLGTLLFFCLAYACAQTTPATPPAPASAPTLPNLPDETPVAVFPDGTSFTMGDFRKIYAILPPQNQQLALRDRKMFLQQWAFMRRLAQMAEQEKLDQESPTVEQLNYYRMMIMSQAKLNQMINEMSIEPTAVLNHYNTNKDKYKQVKVKAIYIGFSSDPGPAKSKKTLTEDQALQKAKRVLEEIRAGADFVKLVKANSDDETSRAKNGDFATLRLSDNVPDAVRAAVFALQQGEVSEPVRQPNGFYLLKADEVTHRAFSQVRDEIFQELKQQEYSKWLKQANDETKVEFPSPAFLGGK